MIPLNLHKIIHQLLCIYAFFIPFEHILDIWFGIDTILKPYRFFAILVILTFLFKVYQAKALNIRTDIRQDIFLYLLFAYGIFISLIQMMITEFSLGKFYNEIFQITLYLATFFIIKNSNFSKKELYHILYALLLGVILNSMYVFYNFYILADYSRPKGFMDNPNYLSLSVAIAIIVLVRKLGEIKGFARWALLLLIPFMTYIFIISGSRTGFIVTIIASLLIFFFQPFKGKTLFLLAFFGLSIFFISSKNVATPLILLERINDRNATEDPRIALWKGVLRASEETSYVGMGLGQFEAQFPSFYQDENHYEIREVVQFGYHLSTHSDYFAILITYGALGLVLFILFFFYSFKKVIPLALLYKQEERKKHYELQLIILVSVAIFGLAAENFSSALYWLLLTFSTKSLSLRITDNTNSSNLAQSKT